MYSLLRLFKPLFDLFITVILWLYFLFGYLLFYLPILIILFPFVRIKQNLVQTVNHHFYYYFFAFLQKITPGLNIVIGEDAKNIKSSIVISNHISYLDPILLISMFPRHKTIVKGIFFKIPIMKWIMKSGGYIPFTQGGEYINIMIDNVQQLSAFFNAGGNLFIFPEGKRSRNGRMGTLQKGAFTLARRNNVPLAIIYIQNTDKLFKPGKFFLNTCISIDISVEKLGTIHPEGLSIQDLRSKAIETYKKMGN